MRLRQIEVFRAVMMTGSVSEAARLLSVSQPVISRVLKHTELGLGFALFERRKGRLHATPEARTVYAQVQRAFGEIERIDALTANLRRGASGLLRIAATPSLASALLPDALAVLQRDSPALRFDLWASHTAQIEADLLAYEIDVGFAIEPAAHVAITSTALLHGELLIALPREWLDARQPVIEPAWLETRPLVGLAETTALGSQLAKRLAACHWHPQASFRVQTYALAGALVEEGLGYAFVDGYTASGLDPERVALTRPAPPLTFQLMMMTAADRALSVPIARLRDSLVTAAERRTRRLDARVLAAAFPMD